MIKTILKTVVTDITAIPFADDFLSPGAPPGALISPELDGPSPEGPIAEPDGPSPEGPIPDGELAVGEEETEEGDPPGAEDGERAEEDFGAIDPGCEEPGAVDGEDDLGV